jgi:three-Cys-motif partner protein
MRNDRCPSCGEIFDRDATACRVCGEGLVEPEPVEIEPRPVPAFLDRLGDWSEVKHEIVERYGVEYTKILSKQSGIRRIVYADAFAGAGVALDRETGETVRGSAHRMLMDVQPSFSEYHFIELDPVKATHLRSRFGADPRVTIHIGDANQILPRDVLPRCRYADRARGLCLLDPYGLTVDWSLIAEIGGMKSVEIFFNFMIVGANRNVLWKDPATVSPQRRALLTRVWGDESWRQVAYREVQTLWGPSEEKIKGNEALVEAYRKRLRDVAGFQFVPEPIPIKNTKNAVVYYLFFASPNKTANRIVSHIFKKFRNVPA